MSDLFIDVSYPVDRPDDLKVDSNIKPGLLRDFLVDPVLRGMMGKGKDSRKADERSVYHIRVTCDLSGDRVSVSHDCGNDGLMTGILMEVANRMPKGRDDNGDRDEKHASAREVEQVPRRPAGDRDGLPGRRGDSDRRAQGRRDRPERREIREPRSHPRRGHLLVAREDRPIQR